jgi:hypothetical protein
MQLPESRVYREFDKWSRTTDWSQPQFIYFNIQAAHYYYYHEGMKLLFVKQPISWTAISASRRKDVQATYWNAVANGDLMLGKIIRRLKDLHVYRKTLLVMLGDHGESLFDDGYLGHGFELDDAQTHIPLVFNRTGVDLRGSVGECDVRNLILETITGEHLAETAEQNTGVVFQYVGPLRDPVEVGMVESGGRRTIIDAYKKRFYFSEQGKWLTSSELQRPEMQANRERVQRLAALYEQYRNETWTKPTLTSAGK